MENLEDVALHLQRFSWPDYALFSFMLFLCILIGLYFGFFKKHTADAESEYLVGNRSMHFFPISLSLIARYRQRASLCYSCSANDLKNFFLIAGVALYRVSHYWDCQAKFICTASNMFTYPWVFC